MQGILLSYLQIMHGGVNQGLAWALLALGVYITFRILKIADLTAEGSFSLGGAISIQMVLWNVEPVTSLLIAFLAGALAGLVTGILHTKLRIPEILAGILTMISMYSINIRIMGGAFKSLTANNSVFDYLMNLGLPRYWSHTAISLFAVAVIVAALYWFFGTEYGSAIRATGSNEQMCRAQGINTDNTKIIGLMISNAIIALSGALIAHQQSFADVSMGVGGIVIGLASLVIGEAFIMKKFPFWLKMAFVVLGSIIYWIIISIIIYVDLSPVIQPSDVKLLTALLVVVALSIPNIKSMILKNNGNKKKAKLNNNKEQKGLIDAKDR